MANLSIKDITQKTFRVTKKYVDTMVEAVDVAKQNKLTYEDDLEEFKKFTAANTEMAIPLDVGIMCVTETLNLEEGKTYNIRVLINTDIPMNISEDLTKNARNVDGKMLLEFKATAVKNEEASTDLGYDIIALEYSYDDCAYDIVIYDKVLLQINEETDEPSTIYSENHAMISIPYVADYLEIGLKKHIKEEVSNDFLKTYKFVTQEDKDNWNGKQDKIKNGVFIKQTPPPDTYGYNKFELVLNILENGLYIATNELSFYDETTLLEGGAELSNGKKDCSFHVYTGHLFQYTKIGYHTEYCYITNLTTGITCCLDAEGGITGIDANNGFMYLDDVEKVLQHKADKSELFSKDYNDLKNRPCYDTRELIELTYDGDVTEKVIATEPLESMVKVSDEVVDYETYIKSVVGIYHPDDGIQYHNMSDKIEGEDYFLTKSKKIIWGGNVTVVYEDNATVMGATFPEKGIYFRNSSLLIDYGDPSYVCFFSAVMEEGEIKQLDEKFIPDSIATKTYVDDAINTNSIVRPYEVFRVEETIFGKTGYIDVETMEPSVKYGLAEEYLDCSSFAFVVPTVTTPYAIVCIASSFQVSDLMVTEKWEGNPSEGEEGLYIIVQGLNVDYKINIRHKESKDGITIETIRNTRYLGISNTKEFIPTGDYNPATKKYVDDNNHVKYLTDAYGTATSWKVDVNSMEVGFDYKFPPDATKAAAISYRFINSEQKTETKNLVVFTQNSGKIPVIHMYEKVVDSKYVIIVGHELKVQLDVVDNGDGTKSVTVTGTPLTLSTSNTLEYTPTENYHPVTKKYVDDAIANASLGNGSNVSDSGVIEDSEFDDLISGTFGPEYVNRDE